MTYSIPDMIDQAIARINNAISSGSGELIYLCGIHESAKWSKLIRTHEHTARKMSADCVYLTSPDSLAIWNLLSAKNAGDLKEVYELKLRFLYYLKMQNQ